MHLIVKVICKPVCDLSIHVMTEIMISNDLVERRSI